MQDGSTTGLIKTEHYNLHEGGFTIISDWFSFGWMYLINSTESIFVMTTYMHRLQSG